MVKGVNDSKNGNEIKKIYMLMIKIWNTEDELRIDHIGDAASIPSSNLEILCFASQLTGGEAEHH